MTCWLKVEALIMGKLPIFEFNEVITFKNDTLNDDIYSFTLLTLKCVQLV